MSDALYRYRKFKNRFMISLCLLASVFALMVLGLLVGYVIYRGGQAINLDFFIHMPTPVGEVGGGVANGIVGTMILVALACVLGVPVGVAAGLYLAEYGGGKFSSLVRFSTNILNGLPSIVMGLFAYALLVKPLKGFSGLAGGIALGLLMIPTIVRTTEEVVKLVPWNLREAALALGLPQWRVILFVVLRTAKAGVFTAVMLAVARVAGETAPLLFTAFGNQFWNTNILEPMPALTLQIFNYAISPFEDWQAKAWAGALVLMGFCLIINVFSRFVILRVKK